MERLKHCQQQCSGSTLSDILSVAGKAALAAGQLLKKLYANPHQIQYKGAIDLVTEADVASEKCILEILQKDFPGVAILAEESQAVYDSIPLEPVWIIDPLDGTTNFAHSFPWFAVSIAYAVNGRAQVGVIYAPMLDELFCACAGHGAWLNGRKIMASDAEEISRSLLATGFPYNIRQSSGQVVAQLEKVLVRCQGVRRAGAAALDLAYVACGRLDGFWEINLKPWDTAAGQVLVEEAGGKLSDFAGNTFSPFIPELAASNTLIHDEFLKLLE